MGRDGGRRAAQSSCESAEAGGGERRWARPARLGEASEATRERLLGSAY